MVFVPGGFCGKNTGNWLEQVYKDLNGPIFHGKPTRVPVKAGKTTSGIDASLRLGGEIAGTVKSQAGKTLSRVCVEAAGRQGRAFVGRASLCRTSTADTSFIPCPPASTTSCSSPGLR